MLNISPLNKAARFPKWMCERLKSQNTPYATQYGMCNCSFKDRARADVPRQLRLTCKTKSSPTFRFVVQASPQQGANKHRPQAGARLSSAFRRPMPTLRSFPLPS